MKKFFALLWSVVSGPLSFIAAMVFQFWWLYLILLTIGAYKTAAKEWGVFAGIISILLAFVLPVSSFFLWIAVWDNNSDKTKKKGEKEKNCSNEAGRAARYQPTFLRLLSAMIAKIAKADGRIDESEIKMAEKIFGKLGFSTTQKELCIHAFHEALQEPYSASHYAAQMVSYWFSYEMRAIAYDVLWDIACADGILAAEEKVLLEELESCLKLASGTYRRYYKQRVRHSRSQESASRNSQGQSDKFHSDPLDYEYEELGCSSASTNEELRTAYRNLAKKLHPDILRAQGMPEALMSKANARMARINAAWDKIKKARGIKN